MSNQFDREEQKYQEELPKKGIFIAFTTNKV